VKQHGASDIDRRHFLAGAIAGVVLAPAWISSAVAAAANVADAKPAAPGTVPRSRAARLAACTAGLDVARRQILQYCAHLDFPNGAIHAVRALGRDTPLGSGDPYRVLLEAFTVERVVGQRPLLEVPVRYEGHPNAMLKTLIEKKCESDLEFTVQGRTYHFRDLVESARLLVAYPGTLPIDEHSWTIIAMAQLLPVGHGTWSNVAGERVDLGQMIDDTSAALLQDTELIRHVDLENLDPPRDCPIYGRVCGGLHMLYALAVAMAHGWSTPARRKKFALHMRTAIRRLSYDENVIDSVEKQNVKLAGADAARAVAYDARVKLLGHLLEVFGVVDRSRSYVFSAAERRAIDAARERLCATLAAGRDLPFERFKNNAVLYDSATTGICHAYNGLQLSPG